MTEIPEGAHYHEGLASQWRIGYQAGGFHKRLCFIKSQLKEIVQIGQYWLDAGCGSGVLTDELALLGTHGYAIDASQKMIDEAIHSASHAVDAFYFQAIPTLEQLAFSDESFDGVLCSSVIEYLEQPELAFREFHRVTRPNGLLFLSVANRYSAVRNGQRIIRNLAQFFGIDLYNYLDVSRINYSEKNIVQNLIKIGFSIENIQSFDPIIPSYLWLVAPPSLIFIIGRRM